MSDTAENLATMIPDQSSAPAPRVSIGMPVRNGQNYIRAAIDSLLAQTFTDFELIICDNQSSDSTEAICRDYMARDARIRYFRNETNLGPAGNHNRCFSYARGEYFRWHAHDDICAPEYLAKCVETLDRNPDVVVAYPQSQIIDEHGKNVFLYEFIIDTDSPSVCRRFRQIIMVRHRVHRNFEIFGLMRYNILRQTPLESAYSHSDRVLVMQLLLLGKFKHIKEPLFLPRAHASQSMQTLPSRSAKWRARLTKLLGPGPLPPPEWWDQKYANRITFPDLHLLRVYWESIWAAPLKFTQRLGCAAILAEWSVRNTPKFARDIAFATEKILSSWGNTLFPERPNTPEKMQSL
jgi:glycosyltransferase involved in cell wall biosynthesis